MYSYHFLFKLIIIGDSGVGKSCLVLQFIQNKTRSQHDVTIGVEFGSKIVLINQKQIKLQIWDTAGQQNFRSITRSYYRNAIGALLVYDITNRKTFENVKVWLQQARSNGNPYMEILLVGNKSDLWDQRTVSTEEGQELAFQHGLQFIEVSSDSYHKVEAAFKKIGQKILRKIEDNIIPVNVDIGVKSGDFMRDKQRTVLSNAQIDLGLNQFACC